MKVVTPALNQLSRIPQLRRSIAQLRMHWALRRFVFPKLVKAFARHFPDAVFIQIGANDGEQLDPLRSAVLKHSWRGVLVEPVPYVYARLSRNYGHLSRLSLENVAIAEQAGSLPFYHLREAEADVAAGKLPQWYDALGSFRKDVLLKHVEFIPDIAQRVICTQVPCISFDQLCEKHELQRVDLLQMDTEGFDYEIIKTIDFQRWRPALLIYEYLHFDAKTQQDCEALLLQAGYLLHHEAMDTWCIDGRASSSAHSAWLADWHKLTAHIDTPSQGKK